MPRNNAPHPAAPDQHPDDDRVENTDDAIQRLLNDAKRAELEARHGAKFIRPPHSRIPPAVEGEWLAYIEEFELRMESAREVPLRMLVDLPYACPLADLPESLVEAELVALLERFARHEVFVDFPEEVEAAEAYRFIVEELLDEPVLDLRMPGTRMHFVYGEER